MVWSNYDLCGVDDNFFIVIVCIIFFFDDEWEEYNVYFCLLCFEFFIGYGWVVVLFVYYGGVEVDVGGKFVISVVFWL